MKNANQIRQLLKDAIKYKNDYAYDYIIKKCKEALALLPCETCSGAGKSLEYAKACPECGCAEYVNENLLGENYRECKKCGQDWWLQVRYGIGNSPCPDCQPFVKIKIPRTPTYWYCPTCGKWDSPRVSQPMAAPEHQPYRGIDVGTCEGTMIPLYSEEDIQTTNK